MAYTYTITIPLKFQVVTRRDNQLLTSRKVNFVVEFESKLPITQEEVDQVESALQGKPALTETELIRCVKQISAECLAKGKLMADRLSGLRPGFPQVKSAVLLNGKITWNDKKARK